MSRIITNTISGFLGGFCFVSIFFAQSPIMAILLGVAAYLNIRLVLDSFSVLSNTKIPLKLPITEENEIGERVLVDYVFIEDIYNEEELIVKLEALSTEDLLTVDMCLAKMKEEGPIEGLEKVDKVLKEILSARE